MIALVLVAVTLPAALIVGAALEPRIESWFTRRRLEQAHNAHSTASSLEQAPE